MLIKVRLSTHKCSCACCRCVEGKKGWGERERERALTSGIGGSSFWNVVAPMGGSSFLKHENIQLQTHHVPVNFLPLLPFFTTEPADTLMLPVR